jgi:hypothetical protein
MAVVLDATGTNVNTGGSTPQTFSYSGITVGSGTNRGLVFVIGFDSNAVTGISATWDNGGTNQAMTLLATKAIAGGSGTGTMAILGLAAPTSGNKTLVCNWTTATQCTCAAVSFTGVDQTGGTTSFPNAGSATGNSASASVTITSQTGNMVVAMHGSQVAAINSVNNTQIFIDLSLSGNYGANRAAGAATVAMTATLASTNLWSSVGTDILAFGAGASFIAAKNKPVLQAVKRAAYW